MRATAVDEDVVARRALMKDILREAPFPIPLVRKVALRESIRKAPTIEALDSLFLDNMCGSPYVPNEMKEELADAFLTRNWGRVRRIMLRSASSAQSSSKPSWRRGRSGTNRKGPSFSNRLLMLAVSARQLTSSGGLSQDFCDLRTMAIIVLTSSRKVRTVPIAKRRKLGRALLSTRTEEEIIHFLMGALVESESLTNSDRHRVANDVLECRYDRLLLEDRLDCEAAHRLDYHASSTTPRTVPTTGDFDFETGSLPQPVPAPSSSSPGDPSASEHFECIMCYHVYSDPNQWCSLPCHHEFCMSCLEDWALSNGRPFPCPICRAPTSFSVNAFRADETSPVGDHNPQQDSHSTSSRWFRNRRGHGGRDENGDDGYEA